MELGPLAEVKGLSRALLILLLLGTVVTVALFVFVPEKTEFIGVYWVICGFPWSLLLHGLDLAGLLPDDGYVNLALLFVCVLLNVAIVHVLELGWRRQRAADDR